MTLPSPVFHLVIITNTAKVMIFRGQGKGVHCQCGAGSAGYLYFLSNKSLIISSLLIFIPYKIWGKLMAKQMLNFHTFDRRI